MDGGPKRGSGRTWLFLLVGGAVGLVIGVVVSITTDVPFAPEVGLAVGLLFGWVSSRIADG